MNPIARKLLWLLPPIAIGLVAVPLLPPSDEIDPMSQENPLGFGGGGELTKVNREGMSIAIEMQPRTYEVLSQIEPRKVFKQRSINIDIQFADLPPQQAVLKLRGRGSLRREGAFPNYNISLLGKGEFAPGIRMDQFYLVNMAYDPRQWKLAFSYRVLQQLGLFPSHFQFVHLTVNGDNQGMFLLVEPPEEAIRRTHPDSVNLYRRRASNQYDKEWTRAVPDVNAALRRFQSLNEMPLSGDSAPGSAEFAEAIDLPTYYRWLAINTLFGNGDTLDELFLFERREETNFPGKLHLMAWDFDDIRKPSREGSLEDPLLYSCMDAFEEHVQADPVLYSGFKTSLLGLLDNELSAKTLASQLEEVGQLRDSLDDGYDAATQDAAREARAKAIGVMQRFLAKREKALRTELAK